MTTPAATTLLSRHPEAANSRVGDETVILHLVSGTYFGLDPIGTLIWDLLEQPMTLAALTARLLTEFDVADDVLTRDMDAFLGQMIAHEIVQADTGDSTAG